MNSFFFYYKAKKCFKVYWKKNTTDMKKHLGVTLKKNNQQCLSMI